MQDTGRFAVETLDIGDEKNGKGKQVDEDEVPFEEALEKIGFGTIQIQSTILCGVILLAVLNETMGMAIIIPAAKCDLHLTSQQTGLLTSISFLGIMVSAHLWGFLADTQGRKKIILYTMLMSNLCTLISSLSVSFDMLIVSRFFTGFFISAVSGTVYAYLGEFNTVNNRATVISWASVSVGLSNLYLSAIGWLVLSQNWSFTLFDDLVVKPWRILLVLFAVPGFLAALWLTRFPESPKFLLASGRDSEALKILSWIYAKNSKNPADQFTVKKLQSEYQQDNALKPQKGGMAIIKSMWQQTVPLLKPPHWLYFFICCFMQFGVFAVSGGMGLWFPEIIDRLAATLDNKVADETICVMLEGASSGASNSTAVECTDEVNTETFLATLMLGGLYTVAYILLSLLMKPVGRGMMLAFCLFMSGTCGLLLQWVADPIIVMVLFCVFLMFSGVCVSVINGAAVALFPTALRSMAVSLSMMNGRFGTFVASNTVGWLLEKNCNLTFLIFVGLIYACGAVNFLLPWR